MSNTTTETAEMIWDAIDRWTERQMRFEQKYPKAHDRFQNENLVEFIKNERATFESKIAALMARLDEIEA